MKDLKCVNCEQANNGTGIRPNKAMYRGFTYLVSHVSDSVHCDVFDPDGDRHGGVCLCSAIRNGMKPFDLDAALASGRTFHPATLARYQEYMSVDPMEVI